MTLTIPARAPLHNLPSSYRHMLTIPHYGLLYCLVKQGFSHWAVLMPPPPSMESSASFPLRGGGREWQWCYPHARVTTGNIMGVGGLATACPSICEGLLCRAKMIATPLPGHDCETGSGSRLGFFFFGFFLKVLDAPRVWEPLFTLGKSPIPPLPIAIAITWTLYADSPFPFPILLHK